MKKFNPSLKLSLKAKGREGKHAKHAGEHIARDGSAFSPRALQIISNSSSSQDLHPPEASVLDELSLAQAGRAPTLSRTPLGQGGPGHWPSPFQPVASWSQVHLVASSPSHPTPTQERLSPKPRQRSTVTWPWPQGAGPCTAHPTGRAVPRGPIEPGS